MSIFGLPIIIMSGRNSFTMEKLNEGIMEFNKVAREIDAAYHVAAMKMGISDSERDILYILSQQPVSQRDICYMTGISKQTVNSSVQKMIRQGYLNPLTGEKKELLSLTPKGIIHVVKTVDKLIKAENKIFSKWSEDEQRLFIELNNKYLEMFKKELEDF